MNTYEALIAVEFHKLFYNGPSGAEPLFATTSWMGVSCLKCPLDLWVYQEILGEIRPDIIIETGTFAGGSALYLAHLCDLLVHGNVVTVDIEARDRPAHPRIRYVTGSSIDPAIVDAVGKQARNADTVMVILDSDHSFEHVGAELECYADLVTEGSYLIVEDTNLSGHPVGNPDPLGPQEAVQRFLAQHPDFAPDRGREKYLLTFNPDGYLRRRSQSERVEDHAQTATQVQAFAPEPSGGADLALLLREMNGQRSEASADLRAATDALVKAVEALAAIGAHGISLNEALATELERLGQLGKQLERMLQSPPRNG